MHGVCARLRYRVDHRSGVQAIAGGQAAGLNAELLQGVRERNRELDVGRVVVVLPLKVAVVVFLSLFCCSCSLFSLFSLVCVSSS